MSEIIDALSMPEVFFDTANNEKRPVTTLLYSLEPKGMGTGQCESLKSYVYRLANAHRVSPAQLVRDVLWGLVEERQRFAYQQRRRECVNNEWLVSTGMRTSGFVQALSDATGNSALLACTMLPAGCVLNPRNLISVSDRYCPECIEQHGDVYDAYGRLLWSVEAVSACPIHGVRLISHKCGKEGRKHRVIAETKWLPGACMACGSIWFRCSDQPRQLATEVELWKAMQIADLIAQFPAASKLISKSSMVVGLAGLVSQFGDGKPCVAARKAGIYKSVLWSWIQGRYLPSLGLFLDLCLSARVSLVSVLTGAPASCAGPAPEKKSSKPVRRKPPRNEREAALKRATLTEPPRSLSRIAAEIGISSRHLQAQFPELTTIVIERFRQSQQNQFARKQREAAALAVKLAQELRAKKIPLTWRNFRKASGEQLLPHSRLCHELKQLLSEERAYN